MIVTHSKKSTKNSEWIALLLLSTCFFVSPVSVSLTSITYFGAFLFLMISGDWHKRWDQIKNNKAALSFWLFFSLFVVGIFHSTSTSHFIIKDIQKHHWMLMTPFFMMIVNDECWRQRMINLFLIAMIVTLCLSGFQFFTHVRLSDVIHLLRPQYDISSVFVDHIVQSFMMNVAAFICAYRFLFEKKFRVYYAIIFLLMAINILVMSQGRTGYGIFFLLLCYLGVIRFGWRGMILSGLASVLLITLVFFTSPSFNFRVRKIEQEYTHYNQMQKKSAVLVHHYAVAQRIELWHISKVMIKERPWFGYGTGGIQTQLPIIIPAKDRLYNPSVDYVESIYLNFLLEFGVAGLIVLIIAFYMQIKTTLQLPRQYRCLMQATLIALLFGGLFNGFLHSFSVSHFYALISVVCFSSLHKAHYD
ncbi:MAG: O-antigen ligase family protein [Gammaproteobacteria bacterium]|nr:O-antigen ligase family protein [Gammaproteobacteria bacterium]